MILGDIIPKDDLDLDVALGVRSKPKVKVPLTWGVGGKSQNENFDFMRVGGSM